MDKLARKIRGKPTEYPPFNSKAGEALRRKLERRERTGKKP